jgi:hypothetical protein
MTELYIVYTLIISLVLILSAGLYYFYTKFNQLEGELGFVKNSFNELETENEIKTESGSNFGSDLDHFVSDDEEDNDEATQLRLAEDFYRSLTNNQQPGIVQFEEEPLEKELDTIEEIEEQEEVKPKRKYNKKKIEE